MPKTTHIEAIPGPSLLWHGLEMTGLCLASSAFAPLAAAQTGAAPAAPPPAQKPEAVRVLAPQAKPRGLAKLPDKIHATPEAIDTISQKQLKQQAVTSLQDALRYAPGITLNSGEGGAHGDNVNLRGFSGIDSIFLDGIRDPGSFTRDSFDYQSVEVLQGPASVLFGNGSAGGLVNQTTKLPTLAPLREATVEAGTNAEARATVDVNEPIGPNAAFRVDLMGETTGVADRDYVQQRRWGAAPSLTLGLNTPTTLTISYFHQEEKNIPDYGLPFLFGEPAPVDRAFYYGLKDHDISETNVHDGTVLLKHDFNDDLSVTNTLRYAYYWSNYRVSAPIFGSDYAGGPPAPGTPLQDILVYRDRPSSEGYQSYFTDHIDAIGRVETGPLTHTLNAGVEVGQQITNYMRFNNDVEGLDAIPPTPLLAPDADENAPPQNSVDAHPYTRSNTIGAYATDQIHVTPIVSLDLGLRYDVYDTHSYDSLAGIGFHRTDGAWSPKAALVLQPTDNQTYYFAYTTSFDPASSFLTLAANSEGPPPEKAKTYELGAKIRWLQGMLTSTATLFRIDATNITISDPDDPTLQEMAGSNQRVQGVELTTTGYITSQLEINANYTYLDPKITNSVTPGETGMQIPGAAHSVANLWATYEPDDKWRVAVGVNYVGHRYADTLNVANVPSYVVVNGMVSDQVTDRVRIQANLQNIGDVRYFTGSYYTDDNENHVLPGQGRVLTVNTTLGF